MAYRDGVAVGAFVCARQQVQPVRGALLKAGWLKVGASVTPYKDEEDSCAVHASQEGALAMQSTPGSESLPADVLALVDSGVARWVPGLRVGSPPCRPAPGPAATSVSSSPRSDGSRFTYIELFAGIGGYRVALDHLGGRCVFASELSEESRRTYRGAFGETPHGDITEVDTGDIPEHDLLTGGFPSQTFSKATGGLHGCAGFADARGMLFLEIVRVLHARRPRAFLLENLENLLGVSDGQAMAWVMRVLSGAEAGGYDCQWRLINSRTVLPMQRARVYIVGTRRDLKAAASFAWPELPVLDTCVSDVLEGAEAEADPRYQLSERRYERLCAAGSAAEEQEQQEEQHEEQREEGPPPEEAQPAGQPRGAAPPPGPHPPRLPEQLLVRLGGCARTLLSNYRTGLRSEFVLRPGAARPRYITVRECARLKGFPEAYPFAGVGGCEERRKGDFERCYHQLGNAACPVIVAALSASLLDAVGIATPASSAAEGCHPRRRSVAAALELLCAASPCPDAERPGGRPSLRACCSAFLRRAESSPPPCTGCGAVLSAAELPYVRNLLESGGLPLAQLAGLRTTHQLAHQLVRSAALAVDPTAHGLTVELLRAELLPRLAGCLGSTCAEVRRLAVVTLAVASRRAELVGGLASEQARGCVEGLGAVAASPSVDPKLGAQAEEALQNIEATRSLLREFESSEVDFLQKTDPRARARPP